MDHAREDVAYVAIEPEDVLRALTAEEIDARAGEALRSRLNADEHSCWVIRRDHVGADGGEEQHAKDDEPDTGSALFQEGAECTSERRLGAHHPSMRTRGSRYA